MSTKNLSQEEIIILQKYKDIFNEINVEIKNFNLLLAEEFRVASLNIPNYESCAVFKKGVAWLHQECLPHRLHPGVYIICGYHQNNPSSYGAYIGKSSVNENISSRLSARLKLHNEAGFYHYTDKKGEPYIYEAVVVIGLQNESMRALAPALEEFIIANVKKRIHLLNIIGN